MILDIWKTKGFDRDHAIETTGSSVDSLGFISYVPSLGSTTFKIKLALDTLDVTQLANIYFRARVSTL